MSREFLPFGLPGYSHPTGRPSALSKCPRSSWLIIRLSRRAGPEAAGLDRAYPGGAAWASIEFQEAGRPLAHTKTGLYRVLTRGIGTIYKGMHKTLRLSALGQQWQRGENPQSFRRALPFAGPLLPYAEV